MGARAVSQLEALTLGVLQGLGEFLPISSSGHLVVAPWLLGWQEHGLAFDVALHLGTLLAVLCVYAGDWWRLLSTGIAGLLVGRPFQDEQARLLWRIALASVPGAIAGLLLDRWAETTLRAPQLVAVNMAVMGGVLMFADRRATGTLAAEQVSTRDALWIGLSQAAAVVPGVSRSGATISAALLLGYRREEAARFSFLISTPIILGAALVKVPKLLHETQDLGPAVTGTIAAALVGLLAIRVLLAYVRARDYRPFVYYRFLFAAVVLAVFFARG